MALKIRNYLGPYERELLQRGTERNYWLRVDRTFNKFFGRFPDKRYAHEFTPWDVKDYRIEREREGKSLATLDVEVAILHAFWNWLIKQAPEDEMLYNPARKVRKDLPAREGLAPLTSTQIAALRAAVGGPKDHSLLELGLLGISQKEIRWLLPEDLRDQTLFIICRRPTSNKPFRTLQLPACDQRLLAGLPLPSESRMYQRWRRLCERAALGPCPFSHLRVTLLRRSAAL